MTQLFDRVKEAGLMNRSGSKPFKAALEHLQTKKPMKSYGPKVHDFSKTILGRKKYPPIDSHSILVPIGWYNQGGSWQFTNLVYRKAQKLYQDVAAYLGVMPRTLQEITWGYHKETCDKNGKDHGQDASHAYIAEHQASRPNWRPNHGYYLSSDVYQHYASAHNIIWYWENIPNRRRYARWYTEALIQCTLAASRQALTVEEMVNAVSLISPGRPWEHNIPVTERFIEIAREEGQL